MPKVLALTANPHPTTHLRLDDEIREIRFRLAAAPNFRLEHRGATRAAELLRLLHQEKPDILHFAGHGSPGGGQRGSIELESRNGASHPVTGQTLDRLFGQLRKKPKLIVLNCCYSEPQARVLARHVEVVVGAKGALSDKLAIRFAEGLYEYLSAGESVASAFELAKTQVILAGGDPRQFAMRSHGKNSAKRLGFQGRPEIVAAFRRLTPNREGVYSLFLWVQGATDFAESVVYQICDETFEDEQHWEVTRASEGLFKTYDMSSYGEVTVRATAWSAAGGIGVSSTLTEALSRFYGPNPARAVRAAIQTISKH